MAIDEMQQELKVWDEADALKRLGGKKELLHKIMQSFVSEGERMMGELGKAIEDEDFLSVQLHAHSIKGSSGNVSGQKVHEWAKKLESTAKNWDKVALKEEFVNLRIEMDRLIALFLGELSQGDNSQKQKKWLDPLQMVMKLHNLKKDIEKGSFIDTDSVGVFEEYVDEALTAQLNILKGHIDRFDTMEALALLKTIMAELE